MRSRHKITVVLIIATALAVGVTQAVGASSASTEQTSSEPRQPQSQSPWASYQQPTGPTLSDEAIRADALGLAGQAADPTPSSMTAVNASFADAVQAVDTRLTLPVPSSSGEASYEQTGVVLVVLHGEFKLNASVPKGVAEPSGPILYLVLDAHTGRLDFRGVTPSEPSGVAALGNARTIN